MDPSLVAAITSMCLAVLYYIVGKALDYFLRSSGIPEQEVTFIESEIRALSLQVPTDTSHICPIEQKEHTS